MVGADGGAGLAGVEGLIEREDWSGALKALGDLRRGGESSVDFWRLQSQALRGAGELQQAQFAVDRWVGLVPDDLEPVRVKAALLAERGKAYAAAEVATEVTERAPDDPDAFFQLASYYRAAGLAPRARTAITRSIELDRGRWQSYELAGLIEDGARQPATAANFYREALRLDPDNGRVADLLRRSRESAEDKHHDDKRRTSQDKADAKARTKSLSKLDKDEAKRRRAAERALNTGAPKRRGVWIGFVVLLLIVGGVAYTQVRPRNEQSTAVSASSTTVPVAGPGAGEGGGAVGARRSSFVADGRDVIVDERALTVGSCFLRTVTDSSMVLDKKPCDQSHNAEVAAVVDVSPPREPNEVEATYMARVCPEATLTAYAPSLRTNYPTAVGYGLSFFGEGHPTWCLVMPWGESATSTGAIRGV